MPYQPPSAAEDSEPTLRFLRRRVALFGLGGFGIGFTFWLFRLVAMLLTGRVQGLTHPSFASHLVGALCMGAIWLILRTGPRSARFVHTVEVAGLLTSAAAYEAMTLFLEPRVRPELVVTLVLTWGFVLRAVFVPSSARRTVLVTAVAGLPLIVFNFLQQQGRGGFSGIFAVAPVVWWTLTTAVCAAASRVIYGLRRQVRRAEKLGQYTLLEKLGEGGMGAVYRASHAMLRRPTAIKLLLPDKTGPTHLALFEQEVQLTAKLAHPNIVTIFDYGRTPDGVFYYAMELLDGATLEEVIAVDGPQSPERVVHILEQVAEALAEAHEVGLIHRDIKPPNIILCRRGRLVDVAKVVDFGLVKRMDGDAKGLIKTDTIVGTPLYLSPEAVTNPEAIDARSDLYSVGAVAYYLLTGQHVFEGRTAVEVCGQHVHRDPTPPSERVETPIPEPLEQIILACLEKDQKKRPQSAVDLQEQLRNCPGFGQWDRSKALQWWKTHARDLRTRRETDQGSEGPRTIAVDLERRRRSGLPSE